MGISSGVFAFAVGAGPYPGGLLAERFGLNAPFYAYALVGSLVAVVAWLRVPETREGRAGHGGSLRPVTLGGSIRQLRMLSSNTGFLLVCLIGLAAAVARTG